MAGLGPQVGLSFGLGPLAGHRPRYTEYFMESFVWELLDTTVFGMYLSVEHCKNMPSPP